MPPVEFAVVVFVGDFAVAVAAVDPPCVGVADENAVSLARSQHVRVVLLQEFGHLGV